MRVLIAPNAFKGSLTGPAAARAVARGVRSVDPRAKTTLLPIADGGDGLIDALREALGGDVVTAAARGPLGERRRASYLWIAASKTAVVEMARASGLALVPPAKRLPLLASSRGTGELMRDAIRRGARTLIVGMGGSASNDGGAGMARALGARFQDDDGREIPDGAGSLVRLAAIDARACRILLSGVRVIALSDVTNPLLGPKGSARVFGPQKGATPPMVRVIDRALVNYARILRAGLGVDVSKIPGGGAAGGLGAGLFAFARARIVPGADWVLDRVGADAALRRSDLAVTGEGKIDQTSRFGKAPLAFARRARRAKVPCVAVAGQVERGAKISFRRVVSFSDAGAKSAADAMRRAAFWACRAGVLAVKGLMLAALAWSFPSSALARETMKPYAEVDALYFHRDQPGKLEESRAKLEEMTSYPSADAGSWWRLGRTLIRVGERRGDRKEKLALFQRAQEAAMKASSLDPRDADAHFWLGVAMGRYGETKGILKSLFMIGPLRAEMREVLRLDPTYGGAHHVLGEMLWQIPGFAGGDKKKALAEFEKSIELSPNYSVNYPSLAEAYVKFGEKEKARLLLQKLDAIKEPSDPPNFADDVADTRKILKTLQK